MEGVKVLESIRLENILSYGPDAEPFPLEPLNVLIGPNASGKSNLIEVLSLLAAAPRDLQKPIRAGGGVDNWLWNGDNLVPVATIDVTVGLPFQLQVQPSHLIDRSLGYRLSFSELGARFWQIGEVVESTGALNDGAMKSQYHYRFVGDEAEVEVKGESSARKLGADEIDSDQSVLSQLKDSRSYPEIWQIAHIFSNIRFYRGWDVSRVGPARLPQRTDDWHEYLLSDGSNLALVINSLLSWPPAKAQILEQMQDFYPAFSDIGVSISGGTVQVFFHERGLRRPIPATRLSDGSMRYLCLLAVLCNPDQKGIVCIEEPELGLHPDIIPQVAKLLVEASSRCQLFVTTHSDMLVDSLTETPEAVVVCEKPESTTQLRRFSAEELSPWLEKYHLGGLWMQGHLGGTRW